MKTQEVGPMLGMKKVGGLTSSKYQLTPSIYLEHLWKTLYKLHEVRLGVSRRRNRMDPWTTDGKGGKKSMQLSHRINMTKNTVNNNIIVYM